MTLALAGYTPDTFGAEERVSVATAVASLLDCAPAAVAVTGVRDATDTGDAPPGAARRLQAAAGTPVPQSLAAGVLVDVDVDAVAAGRDPAALAGRLTGITQAAMFAALRSAGLAQLLDASLRAAVTGALAPPPAPPAELAQQPPPRGAVAAAPPVDGAAVPTRIFADGGGGVWPMVFLAAVLTAWLLGLLAGLRVHCARRSAQQNVLRVRRLRMRAMSLTEPTTESRANGLLGRMRAPTYFFGKKMAGSPAGRHHDTLVSQVLL